MNKIFSNVDIGRKNIGFGIGLFLILGVAAGIPLTIDFFGGSIFGAEQYQTWKVMHGYGVFLSLINFFFGLCVDRLCLGRLQKELVSWAFLLAGLVGGPGRMILVLLSAIASFGVYASLVETMLFVLGTFIFVRGQLQEQPDRLAEPAAQVRYSHR